jgi:CheY-like chemotaxis protein
MSVEFRYRLLIVDDDPVVREVTSAVFGVNNYEVNSAPDGLAALALLRHGNPHVLLSDLQMPFMDGFDLLRIARRFFPEIGSIAVSGAYPPSQARDTVLADACYSKGTLSFPELLDCVDQLAHRYPVRPRAGRRRLSPSWMWRERGRNLAVSCNKCERHFFVEPSSRPDAAGINTSSCPHCRANIAFWLESSSMREWRIGA